MSTACRPSWAGLKRSMAVVVAVGLMLVVGAQDAAAHEDCVGLDGRGVACNRSTGAANHFAHWVDGCDRLSDGFRVRAHYTLSGIGDIVGNWDPNGASSGCANDFTNQFQLSRQRICVEVVGCSGWLNH